MIACKAFIINILLLQYLCGGQSISSQPGVIHMEVINGNHPSETDTSPIALDILPEEPFIESILITTEPKDEINSEMIYLKVQFLTRYATHLKVDCSYSDTFEQLTTFYEFDFTVVNQEDTFSASVKIPPSVLYYNRQIKHLPTNYFVKKLSCTAMLMDAEDLVHWHESVTLTLPPPWSRKELQMYSKRWDLKVTEMIEHLSIPTCEKLNDELLFPNVLPLSGSITGFSRKVSQLSYPQHVVEVNKQLNEPTTQLTLTFWIFLTHGCKRGLCIMIQHRDRKSFFTPLILLNTQNRLHVQLHSGNGAGHAFTSIDEFNLNVWTHITLTVNRNRADLIEWRPTQNYVKRYHHINYDDDFFFNATAGMWTVGGQYGGENSMRGFIAHVKLFQNTIQNHHHIVKYESVEELNALNLAKYFRTCRILKNYLSNTVLGKNNKRTCASKAFWSPKKHCSLAQMYKRKVVQEEHETIEAVKAVVLKERNFIGNAEEMGRVVYDYTVKQMEKGTSQEVDVKNQLKHALAKSLTTRLYEVSGCFGYGKAYHTAATMFTYGLDVNRNENKAVLLQLLGSYRNYPLSNLALAYRHQLGLANLKKDPEVVIGYVKRTAAIAKKMSEDEDHHVHTQSEMIRLDQAHQFRDVRGSDSQLFNWLSQQAKMGSHDATGQVAEMLFHGKQGVDVNQAQAVELYQVAANAGNMNAIYNMGVMYMKGVSVEKNESKALEYFKLAAAQNSSLAFNSLGFIEYHKQNFTGAIHYWKLSADLDNPEGLINYGALIENGFGPEGVPDKKLAYDYYKKAADRGQSNACMRVADVLQEGEIVPRDVVLATQYLRYVAEQVADVGLCMRNAIDSYLEDNWYKSLLNHLLATEGGIQLAGYNTALLLQEFQTEIGKKLTVNQPNYFYNLTAELGWSLSLIEMGNQKWVEEDKKKASHYYARSIQRDNNPEALYNLGYIVEHNYPMDQQIQFAGISSADRMSGNLTMASVLYQSCIESVSENNEGYYPCMIAKMKLSAKVYMLENRVTVGLVFGLFSVFTFSILIVSKYTE